MKEDFLHYIWKLKKLNGLNLKTTTGNDLEIIKPGDHNSHAGPDFFNSRVKIDDTIWAGNVEVHIKSSDWFKHMHHTDKAYDNIILHVVYENDSPVTRNDGTMIPVLEIKDVIDKEAWIRYDQLLKSNQWIPCQNSIEKVDKFTMENWMDRLMIERLEKKTTVISAILGNNKNDWEETFYQFMARSFGFKINALPFELLAKALPLPVLGKHKDSVFQLEALLFGQAGFLESEFNDDYPSELKKEYTFLKQKFQLDPLQAHLWKFLRLRPTNFPTIRIAQFAQLIYNSSGLFSKILETSSVTEIEKLFDLVPTSYWDTHYMFDKQSGKLNKRIGNSAVQNIIINTIVPVLFLYGIKKKDNHYKEVAIRFLESIAPEENSIVSTWAELGIQAESAYKTQALIQLKNEYCIQKKCLTCSIGSKLIYSK